MKSVDLKYHDLDLNNTNNNNQERVNINNIKNQMMI